LDNLPGIRERYILLRRAVNLSFDGSSCSDMDAAVFNWTSAGLLSFLFLFLRFYQLVDRARLINLLGIGIIGN